MRSSHGVTQGDEQSIGWKTNRLELGLEGEKRGWGRKVMRSSHGVAQGNVGGRAIHSQSELDKMILKGEDGGRKRRKSEKESNIGEESHTR
jgi:hypothetical protein